MQLIKVALGTIEEYQDSSFCPLPPYVPTFIHHDIRDMIATLGGAVENMRPLPSLFLKPKVMR